MHPTITKCICILLTGKGAHSVWLQFTFNENFSATIAGNGCPWHNSILIVHILLYKVKIKNYHKKKKKRITTIGKFEDMKTSPFRNWSRQFSLRSTFFCVKFFFNSLREVLLAFSSFSIAINLLRSFLIFVQSYLNTLGYHCYKLNVWKFIFRLMFWFTLYISCAYNHRRDLWTVSTAEGVLPRCPLLSCGLLYMIEL